MRTAWARLGALAGSTTVAEPLAQRQARWLRTCLGSARNTRFGLEHGFETLLSPSRYREALPLRTYEDFHPWLEKVALGFPDVLFPGLPVAFERTGGSEGGAKLIPYSQKGLLDFQKALRPWLGEAVRRNGLRNGSCYWVTSPALRKPEELLPGIPLGLPDAAYLGGDLLPDLNDLSALPAWVGTLEDGTAWRLATQYSLVARADLAFISLWSPTFFLVWLDQLAQESPELDELLRLGGNIEGHPVVPDLDGLDRLRAYRAQRRTELLWPGLRLVSAWADGASQPFARELQVRLAHASFEAKGLLCTECVVSTPLEGGAPVLAADSAFFEFLDDRGRAWWAHELERGSTYEVVLTTASGLYRYRTGDAVSCEGLFGDLPRLRFIGRLGLVSDLVGEKLNEAFVAQCFGNFEGFRMLIPSLHPGLRYRLVVDETLPRPDPILLRNLEARLEENPQYAHARRMGQLGALELFPVKDPLARFTDHLVSSGHRPGDLKVPALRPEAFWEMIFQQEHP